MSTGARSLSSIDPVQLGAHLAEARKAQGLTQQAVAEHLGLARATVIATEKGDRLPRARELAQVAELYGRSVGDLLRAAEAPPKESFIVQFRSARGGGSDADERRARDILAFEALVHDYCDLERLTQQPLVMRYPAPYAVEGQDPERAGDIVASAERNRLGLGDGPLGDLWQLLDADVGIRVFAPRFEDRRLAGMYLHTATSGACIAVNGNHPEERRRWSGAHEYAHFLTQRDRPEVTVLDAYRRVPESERFADAFARHFLMPGVGLMRRFSQMQQGLGAGQAITPAEVLRLAQQYGVSFQAMLLRLEDLRVVPGGSWDRLREAGFKPNTARQLLDLPTHDSSLSLLPRRYAMLAVQAFMAGDLSQEQLARYLRTDAVGAREQVEALAWAEFSNEGELLQLPLDLSASLAAPGR